MIVTNCYMLEKGYYCSRCGLSWIESCNAGPDSPWAVSTLMAHIDRLALLQLLLKCVSKPNLSVSVTPRMLMLDTLLNPGLKLGKSSRLGHDLGLSISLLWFILRLHVSARPTDLGFQRATIYRGNQEITVISILCLLMGYKGFNFDTAMMKFTRPRLDPWDMKLSQPLSQIGMLHGVKCLGKVEGYKVNIMAKIKRFWKLKRYGFESGGGRTSGSESILIRELPVTLWLRQERVEVPSHHKLLQNTAGNFKLG